MIIHNLQLMYMYMHLLYAKSLSTLIVKNFGLLNFGHGISENCGQISDIVFHKFVLIFPKFGVNFSAANVNGVPPYLF